MKVRWVFAAAAAIATAILLTSCSVPVKALVSLSREGDVLIAHVQSCWGEEASGLKLEAIRSGWPTPPAREWEFEASAEKVLELGTIEQVVASMTTYAEIDGRLPVPTMAFSVVGIGDPTLSVEFNEQDLYLLQERDYLVFDSLDRRTFVDGITYARFVDSHCGGRS